MLLTHIAVGGLWLLYGVLHSMLANETVKAFFQQKLGNNYKHYRLGYTLFAALTFAGIIAFQFSIHSKNIFAPSTLSKGVGGFIAFCGLLLMLFCIKKYFMSLSGLRSILKEDTGTELMIGGVHRYVRHPLYLGTFLFLWGLLIYFPSFSILISNAVITFYTLVGIKLEEEKLVRIFGDRYRDYQKAVPKLIPKL